MAPFKVFLSHSTKDVDFVKKLAEELEHAGIDPWLCEVDIIPGDNFVAEIEKGLSGSDLVALLWSPDAARSRWMEVEWTSVLDREISESRTRLGVVFLRDAKLPELLRTKIYIDARTDLDKGLRETVSWMTRMRDMRQDAGVRAPRCFLDYEPTDFVGRAEQLEALYAALAQKQGTFLLYGQPGSGKSRLALKYAWEAQGTFDAVVFQLCGQRSVAEIGVELAMRLKLDVGSLSPDKQIRAAKECLLGKPGSRSLLVLDDIWNDDIKELLPGPPVSVLCTSRRRTLPWVSPSGMREVQSFTREEAETIFRIYLGEETARLHREALLGFAERVERLPIAVVVAASLLRQEFDPIDEATRGLQLERLHNEIHNVPDLLQRAIASQGKQEIRLLEAMAVCSAEGFWLALPALIAGLDLTAAHQSRDRLINSSLLRLLDRDRQRLQLHGLLREQLRKNPNMADIQAKHAAVLERGFHDWKDSLRQCSECLQELIPAMKYLWKTGHPDRVAQLAYWGFAVGEHIGNLDVALAILKQEESFWEERKDARAKRALQANYGNQALILRMWGLLEEAMKLRKKEEGFCLELNIKDGLQASYGNQALILQDGGQLNEAMALLKKQEELCLELGDKDGLQGCYCNHAVILAGRGRPDEAMRLFRKQEELCLELGDKEGLVVSKGNQALILKNAGRLDEAMELLKNLEPLFLEFGKKADLGNYYLNWGLLARKQKEAETGRKKLQKALEIFTELNMPQERAAVLAELDK